MTLDIDLGRCDLDLTSHPTYYNLMSPCYTPLACSRTKWVQSAARLAAVMYDMQEYMVLLESGVSRRSQ